MERRSLCPLGLAFFGLTSNLASQVRLNLFSLIHQIVFHSKGGYDFTTIYNMPIWLRKFTYHEISKFYSKEREEAEKLSNEGKSTLISSDGKVNTSEFANLSNNLKRKSSYK